MTHPVLLKQLHHLVQGTLIDSSYTQIKLQSADVLVPAAPSLTIPGW
jgi:hypothetical protein